ncbi:hypothetical protein Nmel_005638 [Mimus melanotis]
MALSNGRRQWKIYVQQPVTRITSDCISCTVC